MQSVRSSIIAALVTALGYGLLNAPQSWVWLAPVALLPVCCTLERVGPRRAAGVGFVFGFATTFFIISWLVPTARDYFERPIATAVVFTALVSTLSIAPYFGVAFGLYAFARPRVAPGLRPWLFGAAWVSAEIARSHLGVRSTWSLLGTSLAGVAPLRQVASIAGVYGLSFGLAVWNAVLWQWIEPIVRRSRLPKLNRIPHAWPTASTLVIVGGVGLAFAWGQWRVAHASDASGTGLRVALVQGGLRPDELQPRRAQRQLISYYTSWSRRAAEAKPPVDLIVWPESALLSGAEDPIFGPPLQRLVDKLGIPVLLGAPRITAHGRYNSAALLRPAVKPVYYDKIRLLPFSETHPIDGLTRSRGRDGGASAYDPGDRSGLMLWRGHELGVTICVEGIYPDMARSLARAGADVLVNLSRDDWFRGRGGPAQHFAQVRLRAVETGRPLLRTTAAGITALVSPEGEVLASLPPGRSGLLVVDLPAARATTFYLETGDWLPGLCVAFLLLAVVLRIVALLSAPREVRVPRLG